MEERSAMISLFRWSERGNLVENLQKIGVNVPVVSKLILINEEGTVNIMDADQQSNYIKRWHVKGICT